MTMQDQIDTLTAAIEAVEEEIVKISSQEITEAELEKLGSYAVPAPHHELLKNNNRFPAPPFSAITGSSKSEIPSSPRSTSGQRKTNKTDDDVSSLASSTVRRSRRGKADDDAESTDTKDTRSTRRSARGGRATKDDDSTQSGTLSTASPKASDQVKETKQGGAASIRSMRSSKRKIEQPLDEPVTRQSSRRRK